MNMSLVKSGFAKNLLIVGLAVFCTPIFLDLQPLYAQGISVFTTASFEDKNGMFIENLSPEEIQVFEDDLPRKLEFFAKEEIPTVYCLLFDRGMLPEYPELESYGRDGITSATSARSLAYGLIDKFLNRQTLWVGAYGRELRVALDFSTDGYRAKETIHRLQGIKRNEDANLLAALLSTARAISQRPERRRVLILFVDAIDTTTAGKVKSLKNLLSASNVEFFAISFASRLQTIPGRLQANPSEAILRDFGRVTAGDVFLASQNRDHFEDIIRRIQNQVRTFYTLGFLSGSSVDNPAKLTIKCARPGSKVRCHTLVPLLG